MELLIVIAVLAYSIWAEVNKSKEEDKVDVDFSELASLDDFFKDAGNTMPPVKQKHTKKKQPRQSKKPGREAVSYNDFSTMTGTGTGSYDELPPLTGVINYDRMESPAKSSPEEGLSAEAREMFTLGKARAPIRQEEAKLPNISFDRESIIKAFIMSEVLQRYDLERIYSRIPNIQQEQED